ncbi:MFS transporter [Paraburkholderia sp. JPY303]|uniref:MFS family permease n=1 Tax=Paraburkholderia atlantica TaxID=2654982 RepID=A0A7W8QAD6_PARAM|nr:MFS transporter [Paraburkholderia atlantica]MBB5426060.1 MFS family permease [Paraburkholderia atlantica]NUY33540.1 MFS transporter [Paraburkholderia atlantica]
MKISDHIADSPMTGLQLRVVLVSIVLVVLDGYDLTLAAFAAPFIERGFGVSKTQLGMVLSGALIGMLIGSIVVAPIADRMGRRLTGVLATCVIGIGMLIGPFASAERGTMLLVISRIITGVGIGALVAVVGVILSEYTAKRVYPLVMAIYAAAINIGGLLGAMLVGPMLATHGWQFGWWVGFVLSVLAATGTYFLLPESLAWLAEGRRRDSLLQLNRILAKMRQPTLTALPESSNPDVKVTGALRTIASAPLLWQTVLMIVSYVAYMVSFYFLTTWAPSTVASMNHKPLLAPQLVVAFSLGGIAGSLVFGFIGNRINLRILTPIFLVMAAAAMSYFGIAGPAMPGAMWTVFIASFFVCAGTAGFYGIVPLLYPTLARSTGYGVVIGMGRFGGIAAPILGGMSFDGGMDMGTAFTLFSLPMLIAAIGLLVLHVGLKRSASSERATLAARSGGKQADRSKQTC